MSAPEISSVCVALERVIRPIVEGQIRGFCKEHPSIVEAVDWFNKKDSNGVRVKSKADTFVDSLSKRIVRDLTCGRSSARLETALLDIATDEPSDCERGIPSALAGASAGTGSGRGALARERRRLILRSPSRDDRWGRT